jgi:DNA repair exonuclease SbcCD nuclease subunit
MAIKIFHTADLHLGMRFAGYPEIQNELVNFRSEKLGKAESDLCPGIKKL